VQVDRQRGDTADNEEKRRRRPVLRPRLSLPFSERRVVLFIMDALVVNGAVLAALYAWTLIGKRTFTTGFVRQHWLWFPALTGLWWLLAYLCDLYDVPTAGERVMSVRQIAWAGLDLMVVYLAVYFLSPRGGLPRLFFLFFVGFALVGILVWRWTYATVLTTAPFRRRVLIAGAGWAGQTIADLLGEESNDDYHVIGFVDDDPEKQGRTVAGLPVLGNSGDLLELTRAEGIDKVVVAVTHRMQGELFQALMDCCAEGVHVVRMPRLYEQLARRVPVEHVKRGWVIESMNDLSGWNRPARGVKRGLDLVLGVLGGLVFVVLLPFLALAITVDGPGPIFYQQVRLGRGGRPFLLWKLRTMVPDAERDGEARWAGENDPRITRVGRVLRKTRLDELPQVVNVLRGEMSVVGPRPERPEFIEELQEKIPFYRTRLTVKPGLTGWAQIFYGYGNSVEDALIKLQYDLYYVRHWSLGMDLYIILKTVGVLVTLGGT
jgi:exopolysaccharide biosynthesis polyprenyl glycosylphosphotransferase